MKLLQTIRVDPSDTFVFDKAAAPGEWAISGALVLAHLNPATLTGKARAAFRSGFLGIDSFGWSTLAQIVAATEDDRASAVELLAARLVERFGAPDLATAHSAAEEEMAFAASLCDHPAMMLVAVSRRYENDEIHETFRALKANTRRKPAPVFTFMNVSDDEESPAEQLDLTALANGVRR